MRILRFLIIIALLTTSCVTKEEKAIGDFLQVKGDVRTDLDFKLKDLEQLDEISARDSALLLIDVENGKNSQIPISRIVKNHNVSLEYKRHMKKDLINKVDSLEEQLKKPGKQPAEVFIHLTVYTEMIYNLDKEIRADSVKLCFLNRYQADSSKILTRKYRAVYTIKNPEMNNLEQEIKRDFYISGDLEKVQFSSSPNQ